MDIRTDFNYDECVILVKLIEVKNEDSLSLEKLIIFLDDDMKRSMKIVKYLISVSIIEDMNDKIYIHHKLLRDLIDEQKPINIVYLYLNSWHLCHWIFLFLSVVVLKMII